MAATKSRRSPGRSIAWPRSSRIARRGARGLGSGAAAAARRRLPRADDTAHGDARLRRNAGDDRARDRRADHATRYLGIVDEETHRLERIIGDLLDLARLEGAAAPSRREHVSVRALRSRRATRTSARASTRRHRCRIEVAAAATLVRRSGSARAGAAEPGGERTPPHARRRHHHAVVDARRESVHLSVGTAAPVFRRNICRSSSTGSTRLMRRATPAGGQRPGSLDREGDRRTARRDDDRPE